MGKNDEKNQGKRIELGPTQQVRPENAIQESVLMTDITIFEDRPDVISYVRIYIPGEFPDEFIADKRLEYKWTLVTRKNGAITRSPMTQKQYLQINSADDFPKDVPAGQVMILPIEIEE